MPTNFESFRYLNDTGKKTAAVEYGAYWDKDAQPHGLIFQSTAVGADLDDDMFVTDAPPGGAGVEGVRSVLVDRIQVKEGGGATSDLTAWLLTSMFEVDDELSSVEILVEPADPNAPAGPPYRATARLYFADTTFEERIRFFG